MDVEQAIRERRTHKAFQPEPVPRELLDELLELARWAPNHHLTNPWRFRVVGPASHERLKQAAGPEAAAKLDRAPTLVAATVTSTGDPVQDEEDLCATACATYLVLLGAHAHGLAGYWRTPGVLRTPDGPRRAGYPGRRAVRRPDPPRMAPAGEGGARAGAPQLDRHLPRLMASLVFKERPAVGQPTGLLVLSHGRGTSELDLLPLADVLDPERRLHVAAPRGPLQFPGVPGYHWYAVPRVGYPDPATFEASRTALAAFHDELWERTGLGPDRTVLGGFSMGTVMSYALGLSGDRPAPARNPRVVRVCADGRGLGAIAVGSPGHQGVHLARAERPGDRCRLRPPRPRTARARRARSRVPRVRRRPPDRPGQPSQRGAVAIGRAPAAGPVLIRPAPSAAGDQHRAGDHQQNPERPAGADARPGAVRTTETGRPPPTPRAGPR